MLLFVGTPAALGELRPMKPASRNMVKIRHGRLLHRNLLGRYLNTLQADAMASSRPKIRQAEAGRVATC
jgi:hypothetical protein